MYVCFYVSFCFFSLNTHFAHIYHYTLSLCIILNNWLPLTLRFSNVDESVDFCLSLSHCIYWSGLMLRFLTYKLNASQNKTTNRFWVFPTLNKHLLPRSNFSYFVLSMPLWKYRKWKDKVSICVSGIWKKKWLLWTWKKKKKKKGCHGISRLKGGNIPCRWYAVLFE